MVELIRSVPKEFRKGSPRSSMPSTTDSDWGVYNSPLSNYELTFDSVLNGTRIDDLLYERPNPVVIDLMAPTGTLKDLFNRLPESRKLGIAVSLEDLRDPDEKEHDTSLGIFQVAGDITKSKTWREIERLLQGRKVDLIIERAYGGLFYLPDHPGFYGIVLQRMWKMLSPNGTILIQLPSNCTLENAGISVQAWVEYLNKNKIAAKHNSGKSAANLGSLLIMRSSMSPKHLPFPLEIFQPIQPSELEIAIFNTRLLTSNNSFVRKVIPWSPDGLEDTFAPKFHSLEKIPTEFKSMHNGMMKGKYIIF